MSSLIIDTNTYSRFMRGDAHVIAGLTDAIEIHVPLIVLGELLAGFAAGGRVQANRDDLAEFMASAQVHLMRPDEKTARHHADLYAVLRRQGTPVPANGLWIAALARQHRLPLLTFDAHFAEVPGLVLM